MDKQTTGSSHQDQEGIAPDIAASEVALIRAGKLARKRTRQAGVGVIIMRDGKIVEEFPTEE